MNHAVQHKHVLVVDRSQTVAERVAGFLREASDLRIVGAVGNYSDARAWVDKGDLAALVVDGAMAAPEALSFLCDIRSRLPQCLLVVLLLGDEPSAREACQEAGADHVLLKDKEFERLVELIRDGRRAVL